MANEMSDKPAIQDSAGKWMLVQTEINLRRDFLAKLRTKIYIGDQAEVLRALTVVEQSVRCNDKLLELIFAGTTNHLTLAEVNDALNDK